MKLHAKEYLAEFAENSSEWLRKLINEAILTNGAISTKKLNSIYKTLLSENSDDTEIEVSTSMQSLSESEVMLVKLAHNNGVNALKPSEAIRFSEDLTVLYGLNGSGKSSYFKILNEIVGGNKKKTIIPNIYSEHHSPVNVLLEFKENQTLKSIVWDNTSREIAPLNCVKVFDTSYQEGLLSKRQADETLIQPFGLHLFSYIISKVDEFKQRLLDSSEKEKTQKPFVNIDSLSFDFQKVFKAHNCSVSTKKAIESLYLFPDNKRGLLENITKQIKDLEQINIEDKITIERQKRDNLVAIKGSIIEKYKILGTEIPKITKLIDDYHKRKNENIAAKQQLEVLQALPNTDNPNWKLFISAGKEYSESIETRNEKCVYCGQPLLGNAIDIVKAYGLFLNDDSEQHLIKIESALRSAKNSFEKLAFDFNINDDLRRNLQEISFDSTLGQSLYDAISNLKIKFTSLKLTLLDSIENKLFANDLTLGNIDLVTFKIQELIDKIDQMISGFGISSTDKNNKIKAFQEQLKPLLENRSIAEQKEDFKKWFDCHEQQSMLTEQANKINTNKLSSLSKVAHSDLITNRLKEKFTEELSALGFSNLDVKLENAGASKGLASTKLMIVNRDDVTAILSEGEQKAVALALFLSESKMQQKCNPIIFDDPVNSLDHRFSTAFAERLLGLDNQIIVFTHNKLFLDAFETSKKGHICKNMNGGCNDSKGKHIALYDVQAEGKTSKGVIIHRKANKSKTHLEEAKKLLLKSPFDKHYEVSARLRNCIECIIDEKVFNNEAPPRLSSKNNRIQWDKYKDFKIDPLFIDKLKDIHGRLSGGSLHRGTESEENPIDKEGFDAIVSELELL